MVSFCFPRRRVRAGGVFARLVHFLFLVVVMAGVGGALAGFVVYRQVAADLPDYRWLADYQPPQMSRRKSLSRRKSEAGSKPPSRAPSPPSPPSSDSPSHVVAVEFARDSARARGGPGAGWAPDDDGFDAEAGFEPGPWFASAFGLGAGAGVGLAAGPRESPRWTTSSERPARCSVGGTCGAALSGGRRV